MSVILSLLAIAVCPAAASSAEPIGIKATVSMTLAEPFEPSADWFVRKKEPNREDDRMAQDTTTNAPASPLAGFSVPTTKILAIGKLTAKGISDGVGPTMPAEVAATVRLYLEGKLDQWYFQNDGNGVVFILNLTSKEEAHQMLEQLPLGQKGLMEFDLMALGPLKPLNMLLGPKP